MEGKTLGAKAEAARLLFDSCIKWNVAALLEKALTAFPVKLEHSCLL
ncbi:MAG: hypothetical protein ACR2IE_15680 [Candidatus Sumerlaeaceae bacterium]